MGEGGQKCNFQLKDKFGDIMYSWTIANNTVLCICKLLRDEICLKFSSQEKICNYVR